MFKRPLALAIVGLTLGLGACDNREQEQAQQPNRSDSQQQGMTPQEKFPGAQPPASTETPPPSSQEKPAEQQQDR
jgi:hypothetical protein